MSSTEAGRQIGSSWPLAARNRAGRRAPVRRRISLPALVGLLLLAMPGSLVASSPTALNRPPSGFELYVMDAVVNDGRQHVTRLDPLTLEDRRGGIWLPAPSDPLLSGTRQTRWVASTDGSTIASLESVPDWRIDVGNEPREPCLLSAIAMFDRESKRRHSWRVGGEPDFSLNATGSRLLVRHDCGGINQWEIVNTTTGQEIRPFSLLPIPPGLRNPAWLDPPGERFYYLAYDIRNSGPAQTQLVVYDLMIDAEIGRLDLPGVRAGDGSPGSGSDRFMIEPGWAFSPDGQQLAIAHGDGGAVTLIDLVNLAVERTITVSEPSPRRPPRPRYLRWTRDSTVPAQFLFASEWGLRQVVYAGDGQSIYLGGVEGQRDVGGSEQIKVTGLLRVDLVSGAVMAHSPIQVWDWDVPWSAVPSPDGSSLYVIGFPTLNSSATEPPARDFAWRLYRLDARTLQVRAERTFEDRPIIFPVPHFPANSPA